MVYIPTGYSAYLDLQQLGFETTKIWWYNPRNGESTFLEETSTKEIRNFTPPSNGRGNDWILVLDNAKMDFPPPGTFK
jgi:hypothetical protein